MQGAPGSASLWSDVSRGGRAGASGKAAVAPLGWCLHGWESTAGPVGGCLGFHCRFLRSCSPPHFHLGDTGAPPPYWPSGSPGCLLQASVDIHIHSVEREPEKVQCKDEAGGWRSPSHLKSDRNLQTGQVRV